MTIPTGAAASAYSAVKNLGAGARPGGGGLAGGAALGGAGGPGANFGQLLQGALDGVVDSGRRAETQAVAAATGRTDLVGVVTAVAESETALQTLVAVRDRVISAYEEIMRMQI